MRYVVLLRAVNVGGRNKVPMADFRELLGRLGHGEVSTYIQSGNALFTSDRDDIGAMEAEIEDAIRSEMGVETSAFIRSADDLAVVIDGNPFGDVPGCHVSFLSSDPGDDRRASLDPASVAPDLFHFGDRALYLVYPNGVQGSKLTNTLIERRLGVKATARNWNTVNRLLALARQ